MGKFKVYAVVLDPYINCNPPLKETRGLTRLRSYIDNNQVMMSVSLPTPSTACSYLTPGPEMQQILGSKDDHVPFQRRQARDITSLVTSNLASSNKTISIMDMAQDTLKNQRKLQSHKNWLHLLKQM